MFYKTEETFRDFIIDCSKNEFLPIIATFIDNVVVAYDFQKETFLFEKKEKIEEQKKRFEQRFRKVFLMDIPEYTEHLKQREELYELNIEQMKELLFQVRH